MSMRPIEGRPLDTNPMDGLEHVEDLLYYDGPFISHFRAKDGVNHVIVWLNHDDEANRWLLAGVSTQTLDAYLDNKISLLTLLRDAMPGRLFAVDLMDDVTMRRGWAVELTAFAEHELPSEESFLGDSAQATVEMAVDYTGKKPDPSS